METEKGDTEGSDIFNKRSRRPSRENEVNEAHGRKKPGATKGIKPIAKQRLF
jgi:hypothetical protein